VVLVQNYGLSALAVNLAGRLRGLPTVMLVGNDAEGYYRARRGSRYGPPYRRGELAAIVATARANALLAQSYVVVSEYLRDVVYGHGARCPVAVIPFYGVDCEAFRPAVRPRREIRRELGLPDDGSLLFFCSRIAHEKDVDTLLLAVRALLEGGREVWLLNRSGGHQQFLAAATAAGVGHRTIATEPVHPLRELPLSYQGSDLCVQASRAEGLGISPLEALACECPVVASAIGGLKETVREGETGWTYQPGDAVGLARQIERALGDPVEAARRARRGREMVLEQYEASQMERRFTAWLVGAAGLQNADERDRTSAETRL
jgi:glycosyltransferase involved in cell wall biosynthesis